MLKLILFTISGIITISAVGQEVADIDSLFRASASANNFSGVVLIAKNNSILYQQSFGYANLDTRKLNDANTAFSIASVGKVFTATLIMKLEEEGKLKLDDPISLYINTSIISNGDKIKIHHLLSHTSGLGNYMAHPYYGRINGTSLCLDDIVPLIAGQDLLFNQPGLRHEYSNSGYIILGKIIEQITGKKYEEVLDEIIFKPLSITSATMHSETLGSRVAKGYWKEANQGDWVSTEIILPAPLSDGGIFISAPDLFQFNRGLCSGKIIGMETLDLMKQKHAEGIQPGIGKINYGYGLMVTDFHEKAGGWGHNGGSPGYGAEFRNYRVNEDTFTLIIMANYDRVIRPLFFKVQEMILNGGL